jgi:DNA-binding transcriptional LysR family regulator
MDFRVLRYFLAVAEEGNITKAAETLRLTQPTLSRQIIDLETELGAKLFTRGKRNVTLTEEGTLFRARAREIFSILETARGELSRTGGQVAGAVELGAVESTASELIGDLAESFGREYPGVRYALFTANGDGIRERLDRGQLDAGIFLEPVETASFDFVRLPYRDRWGLVTRADDPLAAKGKVTAEDIKGLPLNLPSRPVIVEEVAAWLGLPVESLNVYGTHNLVTNALVLVRRGLCRMLTIGGALAVRATEGLAFLPFEPERTAGHVLAWKRNREFSPAADLFIRHVRLRFAAPSRRDPRKGDGQQVEPAPGGVKGGPSGGDGSGAPPVTVALPQLGMPDGG